MTSWPHEGRVIAIIACCCVLRFAEGDDGISARPRQVDEWIQQLGDDSYNIREKASSQLSALGLTAKPELLAGIRGTDPEIRWRCARLWEAVRETDFQIRAEAFLNDPDGTDNHEFPGWDRYRKRFGTSREARQTFLSLQSAEPVLWEEFGDASADNPLRFRMRCQQLRNALGNQQGRTRIEGTAAMTVLFMSETYESMLSAEDRQWLSELWNVAAVVDIARSDKAWGDFKSAWFGRTDDPRPAFERLMAGLSTDGDKVVPIARQLLQDQAIPSSQKQFALLALAKSQLQEDDVLIQGFLNDSTMIDTYFSRGVVIKSQLRDIALAALIARADKDPTDFGFKYLRRDDRMLFSPSTVGFKDEDERRAAFEKWLSRATGRDDAQMPYRP